jgi:hypothetical protein
LARGVKPPASAIAARTVVIGPAILPDYGL